MTWVELPHASFTANVYRTRANVTFSPTMFISALVQYNSTTRTAGTNVRYAWEYRRGSELFVAYTDEQNMSGSRVSSRLLSRAVAVKIHAASAILRPLAPTARYADHSLFRREKWPLEGRRKRILSVNWATSVTSGCASTKRSQLSNCFWPTERLALLAPVLY